MRGWLADLLFATGIAQRWNAWVLGRWIERWDRRRAWHLRARTEVERGHAPQRSWRDGALAATPWVPLVCSCPCGCDNEWDHYARPDEAWPTRCYVCRAIDRELGYLTPRPRENPDHIPYVPSIDDVDLHRRPN